MQPRTWNKDSLVRVLKQRRSPNNIQVNILRMGEKAIPTQIAKSDKFSILHPALSIYRTAFLHRSNIVRMFAPRH